MTQEEFDKAHFCCGMSATYDGSLVVISAVDLKERLFEIVDFDNKQPEPDDFYWVRCESLEMTK